MKRTLDLTADDVNKAYLPSLDGLRGIAIGLILLHHCFGKLFAFCWIGVDLFFVLSGFLITRILLNTREQKDYLKNFYMRRVLRIFPLYYAVLIVMLIVLPLVIEGFRQSHAVLLDKQVWYWTYTSNWLTVMEGWLPGKSMVLGHFWSLAIEEQYYLFWPFVVLLCPARKLPWVAIPLILMSVALRFSGVFHNPGYYVATVTRMDGLLIGSLLAWCAVFQLGFLRKWGRIIGIGSGIALLAALAYTRNPDYSNPFMVGPGYTLLALFFFSLLAWTLQPGQHLLQRLIRVKPLLWLGKYSYGLYVLHYIIFWGMKDGIADLLAGRGEPVVIHKLGASVVCVGITFMIALTSYHFMEQPFLKLKRHFPTTS